MIAPDLFPIWKKKKKKETSMFVIGNTSVVIGHQPPRKFNCEGLIPDQPSAPVTSNAAEFVLDSNITNLNSIKVIIFKKFS